MSRFALAQTPAPVRRVRDTDDGDPVFIGLDMTTPKEYLQAGYYSSAINKRMTDGRAATRPGTAHPKFANMTPFETILGSGIYSNPNGDVMLLIATPVSVTGIANGSAPITIPIPAGTRLSGAVTFDDEFDKCYLNSASVTLVWDGLSEEGFIPNTRQFPLDTLLAITPNVPWSVNVGDRRVFPLGVNSIGVTPILDYTEYATNPLNQPPNIGSFRVNTGTSDYLVGLYPYAGGNSLVIGKRHSLDILANFSGDLSATTMQPLSGEIGVAARKAVRQVGSDLIFPYDTGVYRIQQVIQDRITTTAVPVATYQNQFGNIVDPIAPILKRINWAKAGGMTAEVLAPYYFLAVPLDGSTVNNTVLVYNTVKDKWEGIDQWRDASGNSLLQIDDLWVAPYENGVGLYCVDYKAKAVYVLYDGKSDLLASGEYEIRDSFETRAYSTLNSVSQFKRVEVGVATWRPSITVSLVTDRVGDQRVLTDHPVTKDRTKYGVFGKPAYNPTNVNSDFYSVGRQDHSVPDGVYYDNGGEGINIEAEQQSVLRFSTMGRARWVSYLIENVQGFCAIDGVLMRASGAPRQELGASA